jgi:hypothetical protein
MCYGRAWCIKIRKRSVLTSVDGWLNVVKIGLMRMDHVQTVVRRIS